ncbi:MAG: holo-ACP synthase [Rhodocyclaceae bacterium]|nr:holo-ACP synthase [Rhodocyclaceae bacterium]
MIRGIGTDLASVERIAASLARYGDRFAWRILAEPERAEYSRAVHPARFLAKRFAAKEAFGKALGTGIAAPATLHGIRIVHDAAGKPGFDYGEVLAAHMTAAQLHAHLSISDEEHYAIAFAVIEQR